MKKIIVIDNYDSFTYNLVHYLEDLNCEVTVYRNDEFDIEELQKFDKILLSPGPGIPEEAGLLKEVIKTYSTSKSILGVCLGQQAIAEVFGGSLINLEKVYHGVATTITIQVQDEPLFKGIAAEIDGIIGAYEEKYGNFNVLLTGGDLSYFVPHLKKRIFADQNLIFKGLYAISEKNN